MKATAILKKVRRGDENIGKLIVFAVTIIIAVGVLGTLAYFYNQSRENATQLSVLTSTTSSADDLTNLGFCTGTDTAGAHVSYTPIEDKYTLTCGNGDVVTTKVLNVRGILQDGTCSTTGCNYKVNR